MGNKSGTRRQFGGIRLLPSGRFQARYTGPDLRDYKAPSTFATKLDAEAWLTDRRREIDRNLWSPTVANEADHQPNLTFKQYASELIAKKPLADRTREDYENWLDTYIYPTLGQLPIESITEDDINPWFEALNPEKPTLRARLYSLCSTIFNAAVADKTVAVKINPCQIKGAGNVKRKKMVRPASVAELEIMIAALPAKWRLLALLAAWCALRFGEITELRRRDINLSAGVIHINRGVVRLRGRRKVKGPKSEAGERDVSIPPHLIPVIADHLRLYVADDLDALIVYGARGQHLAPSTFYRHWYKACKAAGRWIDADPTDPSDKGHADIDFHDLRHTGATLAAMTGATLKELMSRLGHSTPAAALIYQHVAQGRDAEIARRLSELANPTDNAKKQKRKARTSTPLKRLASNTARRRPRV